MTDDKPQPAQINPALLAGLIEDAEGVDDHLTEVFTRSRADPHSKALIHRFLERTLQLLDLLGVTGPLPKSAEAVDSTRSERALAWLRRNRWHLLAYTGLAVTVVVLLIELRSMDRAIQDNRAIFNEGINEMLQSFDEIQKQLRDR